jgi:hypothetical protein
MPARCDDGVKNGSESDVDCGQGCQLCALGQQCSSDKDCATGSCSTTCHHTVQVNLMVANGTVDTTDTIQPEFRVINYGSQPVPLGDLTLRYYYTKEPAGAEAFACYWVNQGGCGLLAPAQFHDVSPARTGADRYMQLGFVASAPALQPGSSSLIEIQGGISIPPDFPKFMQTGDYSTSTADTFMSAEHVTLYAKGVLIWGQEP